MAVFGVANFIRDYEDTWEWVVGTSAKRIHVDVSRPHNWNAGDHNLPILVHLHGPESLLTGGSFSGYAQRLANSLKTEVWLGKITNDKRDRHYNFEIEERFTPVAS